MLRQYRVQLKWRLDVKRIPTVTENAKAHSYMIGLKHQPIKHLCGIWEISFESTHKKVSIATISAYDNVPYEYMHYGTLFQLYVDGVYLYADGIILEVLT